MANQITEKNMKIGIQTGTDRTIYVNWTWNKTYTDHFNYRWQYDTGDGIWFNGSNGSADKSERTLIYTAPENALWVRFHIKPISTTYKKNGKNTQRWTATVSPWIKIHLAVAEDLTPDPPDSLSVRLDGLALIMEVDRIYDSRSRCIEYSIVQDHKSVFFTGWAGVSYNVSSLTRYVSAGHEYSVRCRAINESLDTMLTNYSPMSAHVGFTRVVVDPERFSDYTEFVDITTPPLAPSSVEAKAASKNSILVSWSASVGAKEYKVEYTNDPGHFDTSTGVDSITVTGKTAVVIEGLSTAGQIFVRVQAINDAGSSIWSPMTNTIIGTTPTAPTTWQSSTRAVIGEPLTIYWTHNDEDGSEVQGVSISFRENDGTWKIISWVKGFDVNYPIIGPNRPDTSTIENGYFAFDTSIFSDGSEVSWSVQTKGILPAPDDWSPYSVVRSFTVFEEPQVFLKMYRKNDWFWDPFSFPTDNIYEAKGDLKDPYNDPISIEHYPVFLSITTQPERQYPLDYHLSVLSLESYETVDDTGEIKYVSAGDEIYSRTFSFDYQTHEDQVVFFPFDIDMENGVSYRLICTAAFDSGLSAVGNLQFDVSFNFDEEFDINAEITFNNDELSMYIQPYCRTESDNEDEEGSLVTFVRLSVYRKAFDGQFIEIAKDLQNTTQTTVVDPHPELNYARYRIVAMSSQSGRISFYDLPSYPTQHASIVIQWNEIWRNFDVFTEDSFSDPAEASTMLQLPYNIDVSDQTSPDVEKVEYIGRSYPVTYYGTQIGQETSYNTSIPATDNESLYAIRKLMKWMGNAYIRDPNGIGYWANLSVSYTKTHNETVIPITINATRVDGGM